MPAAPAQAAPPRAAMSTFLPALWAPFFSGLILPTAGLAFVIASVDAAITQVFPAWCWSVTGFGLLVALFNSLRTALEGASWSNTASKDVTLEEGSGAVGSFKLRWTCAAMRGWRPTMEDSHLAFVLRHARGEFGIFAVFDGHGGPEVSALASSMLEQLLMQRLDELPVGEAPRWESVLTDVVLRLDEMLFAGPLGVGGHMAQASMHPFARVGSTSCIAVLDAAAERVVVANTGDSRSMLSSSIDSCVALSSDHKPEDPEEVARITRAGGRVVRIGPCYRIDMGLNLSRALGDFSYKANASLPPSLQKVVATPSIVTHPWRPDDGDKFLVVACDGLFERMTRRHVMDYVQGGFSQNAPVSEILTRLLHACCSPSPMELGQDNESVILVQWSQQQPKQQ